MGDHSNRAPPCSHMERVRGMQRLPGHQSLTGAALPDPRAHSLRLQGPPASGLGFGKNHSLALTRGVVTHIPAPSSCSPPPCQPQEVMGSKRKAFFCELGQPGRRVMGHSRALGGSPKNCLVFLTMNSKLSRELVSTLRSHPSGQS